MQDKTKNIIVVIEFFFILVIVFIANIIKVDQEISYTERRKLAQFPKFSVNSILNGKAFKDFEKYSVDQFIRRDNLKELKYWFSINVFNQKDSNKMFVTNNSIYKMEYPLNQNAIQKSAQKLQNVCNTYLQNMNIYYSIIPDKAYYLDDSYLKMDYSKIEEIMNTNLTNAKYIDIKQDLNVDDFYRTDLHWKQENLQKVADKIKTKMNLISNSQYEIKLAGSFYGTYYGQVGKKVDVDYINYLTNIDIENSVTYNYETQKKGKVYDLEKYNSSSDKYDIYLSGATPLITIENEKAATNKELLLFRDSFGSSLAPFMIENYKKVTLIDLRYMNSKLLKNYIEFNNQDVLLLYSGTVLNQNIFQ